MFSVYLIVICISNLGDFNCFDFWQRLLLLRSAGILAIRSRRFSFFRGAARRVRFRGLISGREIVNTLKSRTARTLLTISLQFASNDLVLHLTLILLNLTRELFERELAVGMEEEGEDGLLERASESKIDAPRDAEEISSRPAINSP